MKVLTLALLLWASSIGFTEEAPEIVDSKTIVDGLLKEDGKTRGISVQPKIVHTPENTDPITIEVKDLPATSVAKPSIVKSNVQNDNSKVHQPSIVALNIQFHFDSAQLTKHAVKQLNELGKALTSSQLTHYTFEIAGHTDSVGKNIYNKWLSEQRAKAVKQYLMSKFGLEQHKLLALGYGEEQLLLQNDPTNSVNRRVEIRAITN